jgi:hypothetical protein
MIDPSQSITQPVLAHAAVRVRLNAGSAGLAAALLLYYGFARLAVPEVDSRFALGNLIFVYALRAGGIAMAVSAAWSMTGLVSALLFDATASVLIGVGFAVGDVIMRSDGGGSLLHLIFAIMFILAGVRSGREWWQLRIIVGSLDTVRRETDAILAPVINGPVPPALASQLRKRRNQPPRQAPIVPEPPPRQSPPDPPEESSDGFLASFAPDDPDE